MKRSNLEARLKAHRDLDAVVVEVSAAIQAAIEQGYQPPAHPGACPLCGAGDRPRDPQESEATG